MPMDVVNPSVDSSAQDEVRRGDAAGEGKAHTGCRKFLDFLLVGILWVMLILAPVVLGFYGFGILGVYAAVSVLFAFMGWCVYSTYRWDPSEEFQNSRLDVFDVLLVITMFTVAEFILQKFNLDRDAALPLFLGFGTGAMWLRRRLFPRSVVRYKPTNIALRSASIFCGLYFPVTVLFAFSAKTIDAPFFHIWFLSLAAVVLLFLAGWFYWLEYRRARKADGRP